MNVLAIYCHVANHPCAVFFFFSFSFMSTSHRLELFGKRKHGLRKRPHQTVLRGISLINVGRPIPQELA